MLRISNVLLVAAIVTAADQPVVIELPRAGEPLRIELDGGFSIAGRGAAQDVAAGEGASDRSSLTRKARSLAAVHPGARIRPTGWLAGTPHRPGTRVAISDLVAVRVPNGADPRTFCAANGLALQRSLGWADGIILAKAVAADPLAAVDAELALRAAGTWAEAQIAMRVQPLLTPTDPLFAQQWHLNNTGQSPPGGTAGADIDVTATWDTYTGTGIKIAVVDDGIDTTHEDLQANFVSALSTDIADDDSDPMHELGDYGHGTWVSGILASSQGNAKGGCGVAFNSGLVGVRLFGPDGFVTWAQIGDAMAWQAPLVDVSNNSWRVYDLSNSITAIDPLMVAGLTTGTSTGRSGRGTVYVFASGNEAESDDNADWNQLAANRRVIAVGALTADDVRAPYSNAGSCLLLSAPGGDLTKGGVVTTNWDSGELPGPLYTAATDYIAGTSFATPCVSGAVALLLQARPSLSWRDVPHLLARGARKNDASDPGWSTNGAGLHHNPAYGFGALDVGATIALAPGWVLLPPESSITVVTTTSQTIPDNSATGAGRTFDFSGAAGDFVVERAVVTVNMSHANRGDVQFSLTSPDGTVSTFVRRSTDSGANLSSWTFTTVRSFGERATGTWRLDAKDLAAGFTGTLGACSLSLYGYRPYALPVQTSLFPSAALVGSASTSIEIDGSGFGVSQGGDAMTSVAASGVGTLTPTSTSSGWIKVLMPDTAMTVPVTITLTGSNPQVPGRDLTGSTGGGTAASPVTFTVRAGNQKPVLSVLTSAGILAGHETTTANATFVDPDDDTIRYSITTDPGIGTATIDAVTGLLHFSTPITAPGGAVTIGVTATDGIEDSLEALVTVVVTENPLGHDTQSPPATTAESMDDGNGNGGCGAGTASAVLLAMLSLLGFRRRR